MNELLVNKVAIVTGAGAGIGQATAKLFANEGAVVFAADIKELEWIDVPSLMMLMSSVLSLVHTMASLSPLAAMMTSVLSLIQAWVY